MNWSLRRQITYLLMFLGIILVVVGIPLVSFFYEKPTCFDGKQNAGEQGVDCNGACMRLCSALQREPIVAWAQAFEVTEGDYSAVAYVQNQNINAQALSVPYTFTFRSATNEIVGTREGTVYIPAGKNTAVFESDIALPKDAGTIRASFELGKDYEWSRVDSKGPQLSIKNQKVTRLKDTPTVTAEIENPSFNNVGKVNATAILYDTEGNAVGASKTFVEKINKQTAEEIIFTWPRPFSGEVVACQEPTDIVVAIDRSGSMASDSKNPPEPLTTVKDAALAFVDALQNNDKAALLSFATDASDPIDQPLTTDHTTVKDAINQISIDSGSTQYTNIADAIQKAVVEFASSRHRKDVAKAIVLLTDGKPTYPTKQGDANYPLDRALAAARDAQSKEISIFAIGLGNDIDDNFMKDIAGNPERYYRAPTRADLDSVYAFIGAAICKRGPARVEIIPEIQP